VARARCLRSFANARARPTSPFLVQARNAIAMIRGSFDAGSDRCDRALEGAQLASDLTRNPGSFRLVREPLPVNLRLTNARMPNRIGKTGAWLNQRLKGHLNLLRRFRK
jgi:hypothetical protein